MEFFDVVGQRRSVRCFQERDVEWDKVEVILMTADAAPSAGNLQGYEVVLVQDKPTREALAQASYGQQFVAQAPVVLVFCADHLLSASKYGTRGAELYSIQDATIAAAYSQLAATNLGLATVWVGAFNPEAAARAISCPEEVTPVAIIPIGYPAEEPPPRPRRELEDLVRRERF